MMLKGIVIYQKVTFNNYFQDILTLF